MADINKIARKHIEDAFTMSGATMEGMNNFFGNANESKLPEMSSDASQKYMDQVCKELGIPKKTFTNAGMQMGKSYHSNKMEAMFYAAFDPKKAMMNCDCSMGVDMVRCECGVEMELSFIKYQISQFARPHTCSCQNRFNELGKCLGVEGLPWFGFFSATHSQKQGRLLRWMVPVKGTDGYEMLEMTLLTQDITVCGYSWSDVEYVMELSDKEVQQSNYFEDVA